MMSRIMSLVVLFIASVVSAVFIDIHVDHYTDVVWSTVLTDYMTCENVNRGNITAYMVTNTTRKLTVEHSKCVEPSSRDIYEMVPVYSKAVDLHFKNKYCSNFIAAHEFYVEGPDIYSTLTYWSIVVDLECFLEKLSELSKAIPYNVFLLKLLNKNSECTVNFHPPLEYDVSVGIGQQVCMQNIKSICATIGQVPSDTTWYEMFCSVCSWVLLQDLCLNPRYIEETQLKTYIMLRPPDDTMTVINSTCFDQDWILEKKINPKPECFAPIQSVTGLITNFWVRLLAWDAEAILNDTKIIAKLEQELNLDRNTLVIRIVERSNKTNGRENAIDDTEYQEAFVRKLGKTLRCRRMYVAIIIVGYMDLDKVKAVAENITTILKTSYAFDINKKITAHLILRQPTCFRKQASSGRESVQFDKDDTEYTYHVIKQVIAMSIGFLIPVTIVSVGACLSVIQYSTSKNAS